MSKSSVLDAFADTSGKSRSQSPSRLYSVHLENDANLELKFERQFTPAGNMKLAGPSTFGQVLDGGTLHGLVISVSEGPLHASSL